MEIQHCIRLTESLSADPTRRTLLRGVGGGLATTFLLATNRAGAASGTEDAARVAMGALNQALAIGDDSRLDNDFAPDVVVHPRHRMIATGKEVSPDLAGMKAALADIRNAVPDLELAVNSLVAGDDKAAGCVTVSGTPVWATAPVEASALVFMVFDGRRVKEIWFYLDPYATMAIAGRSDTVSSMPSA